MLVFWLRDALLPRTHVLEDGFLVAVECHDPGALDRLPEEKRVVKAQEAPFELSVGETLNLRIFLDHSILEVYANSRQCITQRIYPTRSDSVGISLFSGDGSVNVKSIRAWDMAPANN